MYGDPADTGDGFLSALMNPALAGGLGGLASGFAQAAMPSRMPVPFGAALGLAAGGMQSGIRSAYQNQLAEQQARAAGLQNQFTANQLALWKRHMGDGTTAPMGTPTTSGGGEGGGGVGQTGSQPFISPDEAAFMSRILSMNPQTARAAGPWLGYFEKFAPAGGAR